VIRLARPVGFSVLDVDERKTEASRERLHGRMYCIDELATVFHDVSRSKGRRVGPHPAANSFRCLVNCAGDTGIGQRQGSVQPGDACAYNRDPRRRGPRGLGRTIGSRCAGSGDRRAKKAQRVPTTHS